jgi:hypothetical protein
LYRFELLNCAFRPLQNIQFIWHKYGPFNDLIINDLLYHDLYILVSKIGVFPIEGFVVKFNQPHVFVAQFRYGNITVEIDYNRLSMHSHKTIFLDGAPIRFSNQDQDPLMEIILGCLTERHDFELNQEINLQTMRIMDYIKEEINGIW